MKKTTFEKLRAYALTEKDLTNPLVIYSTEIKWLEGMPYLASAPVKLSAAPENAMKALLKRCLDLPYDGKDPALQGLTQGEAMMINLSRDAADGDHSSLTTILDRLLGKPQQNVKSVQLTGDINDFLDKVAAETEEQVVTVPVEDAQFTEVGDL